MRILIWLLVTAAGLSVGFSQNREIDSLRQFLTSRDKENPANSGTINSQLAWLFYNHAIYDSAIHYYKQALASQHETPNLSWLGNVHFGIGSSYASVGRADSAIIYFQRALNFFFSIRDDDNIEITSANLSVAYKNLGLYEEALRAAYTAAKTLEKKVPSLNLAISYHTLASILAKTGDYDEATKYYQDAIRLFAKFNISYQAKSYNNLGELFILVRQYDSARNNLIRAIKIKRQLDDLEGVARTQNRLSKVWILTGKLSMAEKELEETYATQKQLDDRVGMMETLNNLGELYLLTHRYNQSRLSLTNAEKIIRDIGTPEHLKQNLELQVRLAKETKDFANGMFLLEQLLATKDSLLNEEKSKSLQAMRIRYETERKEQQIVLLQQREETSQARIRNSQIVIGSLIVGLLLVGAIGALIYVNLRNARASKEKIELLLAETRHRMKNNLQTLASIFHLQTRHYTDEDMVLQARSSESRVHTMSLLHEKFYHAEPGNTIRSRDFITDLVHKLVDIYGVRTNNLSLSINVDDIDLDIDKALALSLIIQEVICNSFKYAFDHEPEPKLSVILHATDDQVTTVIHDNGIGLTIAPTTTSHGLGLVEALVAQLDGKMQVSNGSGATFTITFPIIPGWKKRLS
jgi:two-component sensor histidine kinase/Tfp pilus assembly protein PilF